MIWIYMIITSLATTVLSKGSSECNLTNPTATTQRCLGELGAPLIFHLPTSTKLTLKKNGATINKKNETFRLNKASWEDSGVYLLEIYDSTTGRFLNEIKIHVEIQAPVSKPAVSQTCLSPEQMKVSCSSEGDGAEIILSLDNNLLIRSRARTTGTQYVTVNLYGQLTGHLTCDVHNNVSKEQTVIQLTSCSSSALVSKPAVSQTCSSPEQMKVSCSSKGDGAEIILSLDNNLLIHSRPRTTGTQNVTVSLYGQLTGNLTCDVQNNISREQTVIQLTSCSSSGDNCPVSLVIAVVRASAAALLLLLSLFLLLRFKYLKSRRSTYDVAEDEIAHSKKRERTRRHSHQNVTPSSIYLQPYSKS